MPVHVHRSQLPVSAEDAFRWHEREGALERLTPPWEAVEVLSRARGFEEGARVTLRVGPGPLALSWVAEHRDHIPHRQFRDVQIRGPFRRWDHLHRIEPDGPGASTLEDRVEYALPGGPLGALVGGGFVRRKLERLFAYRHRVTASDLSTHVGCEKGGPMRILVTGASGLLGTTLAPFLTAGGHEVVRLGRKSDGREGSFAWNPESGSLDRRAFDGVDAVVHLAGESIAEGRWTEAKKRRIRDSRVLGTRLLAQTLASLAQPPRTLLCASATGFYGDRGSEVLTEASSAGDGFLPDVCREWEAAARPAAEKGIRVAFLRFGVVLTPKGGALGKMLLPFQLGAGGSLGSGGQWFSWIAIDDVLGSIHHALRDPSLAGPVNVVSPEPVTNQGFTKSLGRVLGRPTVASVPAFGARLILGEMADALLLASTRAVPARLTESGYSFRYPSLDSALGHVLGR